MTDSAKPGLFRRIFQWIHQIGCLHKDSVVTFDGPVLKTVCTNCFEESEGIVVEDRVTGRKVKPPSKL